MPVLARLLLLAVLLAPGMARAQATLAVFAAGSLSDAVPDLLAAFGQPAAAPVFGSSGLLRGRIEAGAPADIFLSADMDQPRRLSAGTGPGRGQPVVLFTRNTMCAVGTPEAGLTTANVLDRMLDPAVRLATSTPGADPGGDYAWAVFARAEALRPGARATLEGKALKLVGGPDSKPLVPGKGAVPGVFLAHAADMMLGYCSGMDGLKRDVPGLLSVPLPPNLTVGPGYGLVVLRPDNPAALRFAVFVLSGRGQAILARHGFQTVP